MHMLSALLASKDFSLVWSAAIERSVGALYVDNSVVATLSALESGPLRPRDLERLTLRSSTAVTRTLDRLETAGDVERIEHAISSDQRAVTVRITRLGRRRERGIFAAASSSAGEIRVPIEEAIRNLELLTPVGTGHPVREVGSMSGTCMVLGRLGMIVGSATEATLDGLDINGALALCQLAARSPTRPTALTDRLGMTSGGMTKLLDRLESVGFVERTYGRVNSDRRGVEVYLSPVGRVRLERVLSDVEPYAEELLEAFRDVNAHLSAPDRPGR